MSSSNQATELSMDDILASIRRIIAEEPNAKANNPGPRLEPLPEPAETQKEMAPEIAQRGARSTFNQLTQRLNEVLDTQEPIFERKQDAARDTSLGLGTPEDLDLPYTATRKPPPLPEPLQQPSEEAAPTRVVTSATSEMLRRQVYTQTDGNINSRIGRLDPKPLTTTLARTVGTAPAVAFDAYRRKSTTENRGAATRSAPPPPAAEPKTPAPTPPVAETKPVPPLPPIAEAKAPPALPIPAAIPPMPQAPATPPAEVKDEEEALAGRLAASMRNLDATLGTRTSEKKPDEKPLAAETDVGAKGRASATLPPPKPWPESREMAKSVEAAKPNAPLEKATAIMPPPEAKFEAMQPAAKELPKPIAEKLPTASTTTAPKETAPGLRSKVAMPPVVSPAAVDKAPTAAEAAAMLVKSAAPLASTKPAAQVPAVDAIATKTIAALPAADEPAPRPAAEPATAVAPVAPAGLRTLEDTVSDLLRPVLRQWLDEHMPRIFERVLREELAGRVTPPPKS